MEKLKILKKLIAVGITCATVAGSSVMTFAASEITHNGYPTCEAGEFHTYVNFEYEEGNWSKIKIKNFDTNVVPSNYPYEFNWNRRDDYRTYLGRDYWNVTYYGRDRGTAEVCSQIDEYGNVDDYVVW
ncbi:MAG: hypothetical protein PHW47_12305 [Lachnospira sp.]|nr:hypothetical protein [Lachnospira sp.]